MIRIFIIILFLLSNTLSFAENKFDKDLKKISKKNGFVDDLSKLNAIIITHDKDHYNSPKDYSLFSNLNSVKFVNITQTGCKKKKTLAGNHGIALTKCFAEHEANDKNIVRYLEEIF